MDPDDGLIYPDDPLYGLVPDMADRAGEWWPPVVELHDEAPPPWPTPRWGCFVVVQTDQLVGRAT